MIFNKINSERLCHNTEPHIKLENIYLDIIHILERLCSMNECGQQMEWKILHLKRKFHNLKKNTSFVFLLCFFISCRLGYRNKTLLFGRLLHGVHIWTNFCLDVFSPLKWFPCKLNSFDRVFDIEIVSLDKKQLQKPR